MEGGFRLSRYASLREDLLHLLEDEPSFAIAFFDSLQKGRISSSSEVSSLIVEEVPGVLKL